MHCIVRCSHTVQHWSKAVVTAHYITVQYSTAHYSTVQYSTEHNSTVQYAHYGTVYWEYMVASAAQPTAHSPLCSAALYSEQCTLYTVYCTSNSLNCTLYSVHWALYTVQCLHLYNKQEQQFCPRSPITLNSPAATAAAAAAAKFLAFHPFIINIISLCAGLPPSVL